MFRHIPLLFLLCLLSTAACQARASQIAEERLVVFAAASLTEAFTEIGQLFEQDHPGLTVIFNFAGSQQLAHQLSQGAPADVFASADEQQMAAVIEAGLAEISATGPHVFAGNRLVIGLPSDNPAGLQTVADLARPGLRLVLAVPEVPAGNYAQLFLQKAGADSSLGPAFGQAVLENVVSFEQNVRAVLSKIILGEADAGIVYQSDLHGVEEAAAIDIPDQWNVAATYPIVSLGDARQPELAAEFVDFVLSPTGQEILVKYGFLPANPQAPSGAAPAFGPQT